VPGGISFHICVRLVGGVRLAGRGVSGVGGGWGGKKCGIWGGLVLSSWCWGLVEGGVMTSRGAGSLSKGGIALGGEVGAEFDPLISKNQARPQGRVLGVTWRQLFVDAYRKGKLQGESKI